MRDKKANLNMLVPGILAIVLAAILLVFGLMMLDDLLLETSTTLTAVTNETLSAVTETGETVTNADACGFNGFAVTSVVNATGGEDITSGNYTVDARQGIVYSTGDAVRNNTDWNVSYTYNAPDNEDVCNPANATLEGIGQFGDYVDLIVLAIVISIVIGLILMVMSVRKVR